MIAVCKSLILSYLYLSQACFPQLQKKKKKKVVGLFYHAYLIDFYLCIPLNNCCLKHHLIVPAFGVISKDFVHFILPSPNVLFSYDILLLASLFVSQKVWAKQDYFMMTYSLLLILSLYIQLF